MSRNKPEAESLNLTILRLDDGFPGLLPFRRGQRGKQHYIKLIKENDEAFLFVGTNPALRGEVQQALLRLVNEGWSAEGEVCCDFNGQGSGSNDATFYTVPIGLEIGRALLPLLDPQNGAPLLDHLESLKSELAQILGIPLPEIQVKDNLGLEENTYLVRLKGSPIHSQSLFLDRLFVMGPPSQLDRLEGWTTQDGILGTRAKWIESSQKEKADGLGCTILGPLSLMMHHLRSVLAQASPELLGLQNVYDLVDRLALTHPVVSEPYLEDRKGLRYLQKVLKDLLLEGIPIKDLVTIAEVAGACLDEAIPVEDAVEQCRKRLSHLLCSRLVDGEGQLVGLALAPDWEVDLKELLLKANLEPELFARQGEALKSAIKNKLEDLHPQRIAALITDPETRRMAKALLGISFPGLSIIATDELASGFKVLVAGSVIKGRTKAHTEDIL